MATPEDVLNRLRLSRTIADPGPGKKKPPYKRLLHWRMI